jgi:surfactin synthase thioesterase subunit
MGDLVGDLVEELRPVLRSPWAVFGHSMGAAIAHALARATTADGLGPTHLFVSGRRAPGSPPPHPPLFALPKERLIAEVERLYGALPAVLHAHPGLLDTFLPTMRADLELLDTWAPPTDRALACPVTAYGGRDDHAVPPTVLDGWSETTSGTFRKVVLPGGHFGYVRDAHEARDDVAAVLRGPA